MEYHKYLKHLGAGVLILFAVSTSMLFLYGYTRDKVEVTRLEYNIKASNNIVDGMININTADTDMLELLDGIGEKTAQAIVDYREENGDFESIEELDLIYGIGAKTIEKIRDRICAGE